MPTYVYRFVKTGETVEVQQSFDEETLTTVAHPRSGRKMVVKKVFTPVGVTFRGDGFYKTDSRSKSTSATKQKSKPESGSGSTNGDSGSGTSSDTKSEGGSTAKKSEAAASTTP